MKKCRECPASRLPDDKGRGYCPLGFKYVIIDHQPAPPEGCPKPKTHAEAIDLYEDMES